MLLAQATHEGTTLFEIMVNDSATDSDLLVIIAYVYPVALVAAIAFYVVSAAHDPFAFRARRPSMNRENNAVEGDGDYVV